MTETWAFGLTLAWFALTYFGMALGRLPGLRIDRTGIAWAGAALVLATGVLGFDEAVGAVDFATLALLLGMMVVVAYLRQAGIFDRLAGWGLARVRSPLGLLAATMGLSGLLSAVLVNDVVCLALTPLVLRLARRLRADPRPHLVGLALAANIGSTATLTGNPQNMIIGGLSHIGYLRFALKLAPVAAASLALGFLLTARIYRAALRPADPWSAKGKEAPTNLPAPDARPARRAHARLLVKSLAVALGAAVLFFAGAPMAVVALGAAALLLLDRVNPAKVYGRSTGVCW